MVTNMLFHIPRLWIKIQHRCKIHACSATPCLLHLEWVCFSVVLACVFDESSGCFTSPTANRLCLAILIDLGAKQPIQSSAPSSCLTNQCCWRLWKLPSKRQDIRRQTRKKRVGLVFPARSLSHSTVWPEKKGRKIYVQNYPCVWASA